MNCYDYARSYLYFRSDRVNHTPRLQVDASCKLADREGRVREFFMTCACIGENMYVPKNLAQTPTCEFIFIAEPGCEYAYLKKYADAQRDLREAHRVGEAMKTHSGKPATVLSVHVAMAKYKKVKTLVTLEEIQEAHQSHRPINGRTSYLGEDGRTQVILEYPVKLLNLAHDKPLWQVDTGPILIPDLSAAGPVEGPGFLMVSRLTAAYLLYNSWSGAEAAVRRETQVGVSGDQVFSTAHYSEVKTVEAHNELFGYFEPASGD